MDKLFALIVIFTIALAGYIVYISSRNSGDVLENGSSYTANVVYSKPDPSIPVQVSTLPTHTPNRVSTSTDVKKY